MALIDTLQEKGKKIIFQHGTSAEIAFPSHQGEHGTCDFMTKTCAKECSVARSSLLIDAFKRFKDWSVEKLIDEIDIQAESINAKIIAWWIEAGDCPRIFTDKALETMQGLANIGWSQNGFTRNKELWELSHKIDNVRLCLTVEDLIEAEKLSQIGLVSNPHYDEWKVYIMGGKEIYMCGGGGVICGSGEVDVDGEKRVEDCGSCHTNKFGCYAEAV